MFRFIKNIRLGEQGIKYLKYAVGEIILVVIGILIALQFNITKEENEANQAAEQLLTGLQADLKLEHERIDFLYQYYTEITDGIQQIILNYQGKENNSNEELGQFFLSTLDFRKFSKINTNYQTLYGSGLLQQIEDKKLSEEIITYYSKQFLEWSLEIYQEKVNALNFSNKVLFDPIDKLRPGTQYQTIPNFRLDIPDQYSSNFKAFFQTPEVINFLVDLLHQAEFVFNNLENYKKTNEALSNHIQKHLEQ